MKNAIKIVIFGVFFGLAWVAVSHAEGEAPSTQIRELKPSDIFVPKELGQVSEVKEAEVREAGKLIILIQDAHVNYEAQKNLAAMLEGFAKRYGLKLVLVEGSDGDISLSDMRKRAYPEDRRKVADRYLKAGLLSGEEYLDIVSDLPLVLWGVENPSSYEENFNRFLEVEKARPAVNKDLSQIRSLTDQLKIKILNTSLKAHEKSVADFDDENISFSEYLKILTEEAGQIGLDTKQYTNLNRLIQASSLEKEIDKDVVSQQQQQAWLRLKSRAGADEIEHLQELARKQKQGEALLESFYVAFADSVTNNSVSISDLSQLEKYLAYMRLKHQMRSRELWKELRSLEQEIAGRLAVSEDEKTLVSISRNLLLCQKLIDLKWMPDDEDFYKNTPDSIKASLWIPAVERLAGENSVSLSSMPNATVLDVALSNALRFYQATRTRDEAMVSRSIWKMDELNEKIAVLIAGGFHTDVLASRLSERGINVVIITPSVGKNEDPNRYETVLKVKKGLLPINAIPEMKDMVATFGEASSKE